MSETSKTPRTDAARKRVEESWKDGGLQGYSDDEWLDMMEAIERALAASQERVDTALAEIIKDIRDRSGLGDEWDAIDVDIRNEITAKWRKFIADAIQGAP